jgi:hypothetical protein
MKKYIKSAVIMLGTLGDWLAENYGKIDSATKLVVLGYCYGFRKGDPDAYRVVFKGTFDELYYGYGSRDNDFIPDEDYDYEDYLKNFDKYSITEITTESDKYDVGTYVLLKVGYTG